jgi:hypothetical protein
MNIRKRWSAGIGALLVLSTFATGAFAVCGAFRESHTNSYCNFTGYIYYTYHPDPVYDCNVWTINGKVGCYQWDDGPLSFDTSRCGGGCSAPCTVITYATPDGTATNASPQDCA